MPDIQAIADLLRAESLGARGEAGQMLERQATVLECSGGRARAAELAGQLSDCLRAGPHVISRLVDVVGAIADRCTVEATRAALLRVIERLQEGSTSRLGRVVRGRARAHAYAPACGAHKPASADVRSASATTAATAATARSVIAAACCPRGTTRACCVHGVLT